MSTSRLLMGNEFSIRAYPNVKSVFRHMPLASTFVGQYISSNKTYLELPAVWKFNKQNSLNMQLCVATWKWFTSSCSIWFCSRTTGTGLTIFERKVQVSNSILIYPGTCNWQQLTQRHVNKIANKRLLDLLATITLQNLGDSQIYHIKKWPICHDNLLKSSALVDRGRQVYKCAKEELCDQPH
jgi:hypothetical protein